MELNCQHFTKTTNVSNVEQNIIKRNWKRLKRLNPVSLYSVKYVWVKIFSTALTRTRRIQGKKTCLKI